MIIAFHTNQICLQGTEIALFDYAHYNELYLNNHSIIISKKNPVDDKGGAGKNQPLAIKKFSERFDVILYEDVNELEGILDKYNVDVLYTIKKGVVDGVISKKRKTVVHVVFKYFDPHGDVYAYVSDWLSKEMTNGKSPVVPHMINLPVVKGDLRDQLNIPKNAFVIGRYGGMNSFDIPFVHELIDEITHEESDIYFLFMNTENFYFKKRLKFNFLVKLNKKFQWIKPHPRLIFLEGTSSLSFKSKFINTCDVMIHARYRGETFGIAIGEFSIHNRPIITFSGKGNSLHEDNHLKILGDKALLYDDKDSLNKLIKSLVEKKDNLKLQNWDKYSESFSPKNVMRKFQKVFLS